MDVQLKTLIYENSVFRSYMFYSAILSLKMMFMSLLTIRQRVLNNSFMSEEDAMYLKGMVSRTNEHVERVRRGHRNDMENIYLFLFIGFGYIWTDPSPFLANLLYLAFTMTRMVHTCVYTVFIMPQPVRGRAWMAFISPEDAKWVEGQVVVNDTVERMRRTHQNDIENIPIFLAAGFAYLWTEPYIWLALVLYLGFTVFRALHTFVYALVVLPQPTRAMLWLGGFLITAYMSIHAAIHVLQLLKALYVYANNIFRYEAVHH